MTALDVLIGRQPIVDRNDRVLGYELLFRSLATGDVDELDGDLLTSTVIFGAATIGLDRIVGDSLAFVNADYGVVTGAVPLLLPPERTVVELLETLNPDDEVLAGCRRLRSLGYRLALDDFMWFEGAERFLELATIVKIDIQLVPADRIATLVARCREFGVSLLAEKVETAEELGRCRELGFDLFQGFLLSRPEVVPGRTIDASTLGPLQLAVALSSSEFTMDELERIVRAEPALGIQLLQLAAAGARHGMRRTVRSLREALVLLGARQLQAWLTFLILMQRGRSSPEHVTAALHRARMCELLGRDVEPVTGMAFTAGMLSSLDVLMGVDVRDALAGLPLAPELREAALGCGEGVGRLVRGVTAYQAGRDASVITGIPAATVDRASVEALTWCMQTLDAVQPATIGATRVD